MADADLAAPVEGSSEQSGEMLLHNFLLTSVIT
jgi:hypothetical protein